MFQSLPSHRRIHSLAPNFFLSQLFYTLKVKRMDWGFPLLQAFIALHTDRILVLPDTKLATLVATLK
jgi:hypothetical protein